MFFKTDTWRIERKRIGWTEEYKFLYRKGYKKARCQLDLFVQLIVADYHVRELAQQKEMLQEKVRALQKMQSAGEDEAQLQKLDKEQEVLRKQYWYQECELHKWQSSIPGGPMKLAYESLRKNPKWYMQNELIKDCAGRGGCCGRVCGCCEKRESTPERNMGAGHCTTGCACCSSFRGCELTAQQKTNIRESLRAALEYSDSAYLLTMSRAYMIRDKKV
ncbi:uncharacterized protein N7518_000550 [Penicillium psychrosexuale]|uniref:uncharacterized protein n=1 Tax=Penicillium psychrosexuale TaxID=1002107 RepID=UPI0025453880|nr:uncharacterized protein N7518_000550 [Penicillium psychrosexuale]KAJ5804247.1 hypothetical protein N7518_000550 [Penicillium psychrosexuale]